MQGVWGKRLRDFASWSWFLLRHQVICGADFRLKLETAQHPSTQGPRHLAGSFLAFHLHVHALQQEHTNGGKGMCSWVKAQIKPPRC